MRKAPPICLMSLLLLALAGCPTGEEPVTPGITWDPPLTSASGGELDLGDAMVGGDVVQGAIVGTNDTDETISFEIDFDLEAADGWLASAPSGPFDVVPGGEVTFGPRFNASNSSPTDPSGSVAFLWDDHVVTYIITVHVVN